MFNIEHLPECDMDPCTCPVQRDNLLIREYNNHEDEEEEEDDEDKKKKFSKFSKKFSENMRALVIPAVKYISHFLTVMIVLFLGAIIMALIEDPYIEKEPYDKKEIYVKDLSNPYNLNESMYWNHLTLKYDVRLNDTAMTTFLDELKTFYDINERRRAKEEYDRLHSSRKFIFMKWFYFAIVTTTTIGYGDVAPKTDMGKLVALVFFVIGTIVMMTLVTRTGGVCTNANKSFYKALNKYVFKGRVTFVSDELMSFLTILSAFFTFLLIGIWYANTVEKIGWSSLDIAYFWIVTFITVGLGDITYPLEKEVEHIYEHIVYRVFGLALLAGIIDSLTVYVAYRKELAIKEQIKKLEKMEREKMKEEGDEGVSIIRHKKSVVIIK